jgi:glycosyltransferase involved in cell wall biosynthesis
VWSDLPALKKKLLNSINLFLPVSAFTGKKLQLQHNIAAQKIRVLNNCLDPFLNKRSQPEIEGKLRKKYGIGADDLVLLTVTRLKFSEQYKGYDRVVESLNKIKLSMPATKYLIVGKYDTDEKARLDAIIAAAGLTGSVIFTGFAKDEELSAHFNLADIYIMPSTGEGFGIVFIEALFYGLPVIAGNIDGSVDALAGGAFGMLVNPNSNEEIVSAVRQIAQNKTMFLPEAGAVLTTFGYPQYKEKLNAVLSM